VSHPTNPPSAVPSGRPHRRWARLARTVGLALAAVIGGWLALAIHPQPLFAYSRQRANIVLHARAPLPPQADALLDDVVARVARSPLYDGTRIHDVFLCDTARFFGLFALWDHKVGGIAEVYLGGNVFIRPSSIERNRVIGPSGHDKPGDRTLAYFIAHEVTHAMTADHVGRWRTHGLAAFQKEGYADYVAFSRPVDFARGRALLIQDAPEMSPRRSGLYLRYELMVAHLLERQGMTVEALLSRPLDPAPVLEALRTEGSP
jgi:hypothetical protein